MVKPCDLKLLHPEKIHILNPTSWRFGGDDVPTFNGVIGMVPCLSSPGCRFVEFF